MSALGIVYRQRLVTGGQVVGEAGGKRCRVTCVGVLDTEQVGSNGMGCRGGPTHHLLQQLPDHVLVVPQRLLPFLDILYKRHGGLTKARTWLHSIHAQ